MPRLFRYSFAIAWIALAIACQRGNQPGAVEYAPLPPGEPYMTDAENQREAAGDGDAAAQAAKPGDAAAQAAAKPGAAASSDPEITPPMDVSAPPDDAIETESGLAYAVLAQGTPDSKPGPSDTVHVHFSVWRTSGELLFSTSTDGAPQKVPLSQMPPGWIEVLEAMDVGEKRLVWMPPELAPQADPAAPDEVLAYAIELADVTRAEPVPEDVAAPPADAKKTAKGVSYKVLRPGTGKVHPRADQTVEVHYTGWTTDGEMFDSSVARGQPARFPLSGVIPGWTDGLQTMVVGEKTRFWIPEELAYKGRSGAPQGMLVFDVELLSIVADGP